MNVKLIPAVKLEPGMHLQDALGNWGVVSQVSQPPNTSYLDVRFRNHGHLGIGALRATVGALVLVGIPD